MFVCRSGDTKPGTARRPGPEWGGLVAGGGFDWVREPVLNPYTRLAVAINPARGVLRAVGYDMTGGLLPEPVTQVRELDLLPCAA